MINFKSSLNFNAVTSKVKAALGLYADTAAKKMEAEAKQNATWTDRTTNARQSIKGSSGWEGDKLKITLSGGMNYSVYLELAHEKKYACLKPTIDKNANDVLKGYKKVLG